MNIQKTLFFLEAKKLINIETISEFKNEQKFCIHQSNINQFCCFKKNASKKSEHNFFSFNLELLLFSKMLVLRSAWCYFSHFDEFLRVVPKQKFGFFNVFKSLKMAKLLEIKFISIFSIFKILKKILQVTPEAKAWLF
jgi:hypothetical protein